MPNVFTICPICGSEAQFEAGFYNDKLKKHLDKHDHGEVTEQLAMIWFGMAQQVVEDDHYVKEITRYESNLHEADKRKRRADILSKIMNEYRKYKR